MDQLQLFLFLKTKYENQILKHLYISVFTRVVEIPHLKDLYLSKRVNVKYLINYVVYQVYANKNKDDKLIPQYVYKYVEEICNQT